HLLEAAPHVLEADALAEIGIVVETPADAVVGDHDRDLVPVLATVDLQGTRTDLVAESVRDGILDERLKQHRRDRSRAHGLVAMPWDREPSAEPHLHERDVLSDEEELRAERDPRAVRAVERLAKELAQRDHGLLRAGVVALLDQNGDRVQRVEQE